MSTPFCVGVCAAARTDMRNSLSPHHLVAAALAVVAAGLSLFVLSGGVGSLPAPPQVPAAVVAAAQVESAVAAPRPSRPAPPRPARATARSILVAKRLQPAVRRTVRQPRRVVIRRPAAPIAPAAPTTPVSAVRAVPKPAVGKHGKQKGRSETRAKGRHAPEVKQSHKKTKPPTAPGEKPDGHGNHGGGQGDGGGQGNHGGGNGHGEGK